MEQALKNRLKFGSMMLVALFSLLWLDYKAQEWTTTSPDGKYPYGIGGIGLCVLLLIIMPIAVAELATLFAAEAVRPRRVIAAVGSGLFIIHAFLTQFHWFKPIAASTLALLVVFIMLGTALRWGMMKKTQDAIHVMAGTVLASLYLGGLSWFFVALRVKHSTYGDGSPKFDGSTMVLLMILLVVKFTDIGAYFGGRTFGKHKLIPWLSPGKTWEGLFFGLLTASLMGALCAPRVSHLTWGKAMIFGAVIGGIGQLGDLLESMMKRDAEVKDSGSLVPGFGGVLDIIDSPLLAAPFAYILFSLF